MLRLPDVLVQALIVFIVGVAVGFVLGVVLMLRRHRKRQKPLDSQPTSGEVADIAREDTGDQREAVDRRMAHGAYDAAAEIVTSEIAKNPSDVQLKAKLLEIYFVWGSEEKFLAAFREYEGDIRRSRYWQQVSTMGSQLCPNEPVFEES